MRLTLGHFTTAVALSTALSAAGALARHDNGNPERADGSAPDVLGKLRAGYQSASSVHLVASVTVEIRLPLSAGQVAPATATGRVEHWEQGGLYRTRYSLVPDLGLVANLEHAYDGEHLQLLDGARDGVLTLVDRPNGFADELPIAPTSLPNPLYLPVAFLAPGEAECAGCTLTLVALRHGSTCEGKLRSALPARGSSANGPGIRLPGGLDPRGLVEHELVFAHGKTVRLEKIHRRINGASTTSIELSEEEIGSNGLALPRFQTLIVYDHAPTNDEHSVARIVYEIEELEVNHRLPRGVFTIPFDDAHSVWDGDARAFLKQRGDPRRVFVPLPIDR